MRGLVLLLSLTLAAFLGSSSAINFPWPNVMHPSRPRPGVLINKPCFGHLSFDPCNNELDRVRRSAPLEAPVKGGKTSQAPLTKKMLNLRKGEYMCGSRVCRLEPNVMPKNCPNCQYPIL